MGIGVVGRDFCGTVYVAFVLSRKFIIDPTTAEVMAAWQMVEICVRLGFSEIILEGDSMEVVQALNQEDSSWGRYGFFINDAKILLQQVQHWKVSHVKRTANEVAHRLAKYALFFGEERLWCEEYPPCIHDIVTTEALF
jgi:ribonuclease HI